MQDPNSSISQRRACYGAISAAIERDARTPPEVRPVRFFHAATVITSPRLAGYVESRTAGSRAPLLGLPAATVVLVRDLNAALFELNMRILCRLLHVWRQPRCPWLADPRQPIAALEFDLQMVGLEQRTVEEHLERSRPAPGALAGLNAAIARAQLLHPGMRAWCRWAAAAGHVSADFTDMAWRRAIGSALVFRLHRRPKRDYLDYMARLSPPHGPARRASAVYPLAPADGVLDTGSCPSSSYGSWSAGR